MMRRSKNNCFHKKEEKTTNNHDDELRDDIETAYSNDKEKDELQLQNLINSNSIGRSNSISRETYSIMTRRDIQMLFFGVILALGLLLVGFVLALAAIGAAPSWHAVNHIEDDGTPFQSSPSDTNEVGEKSAPSFGLEGNISQQSASTAASTASLPLSVATDNELEGDFKVLQLNQSLIQILIPSSSPSSIYSVTIISYNKYTGAANLVSAKSNNFVYEWQPPFPGEYEVLVHEIMQSNEFHDRHSSLVQPSPFHISIDSLEDNSSNMHFKSPTNLIPCQSTGFYSFSEWDGDWVGPALNPDNPIRTGWSFLPSKKMNCSLETYSQEDIYGMNKKKSIYILGSSIDRGVFLSLVDILLSTNEKEHFSESIVGKCWGRATVQKGNLELMYQDFRTQLFGDPIRHKDYFECHNDKIAQESPINFVNNATLVWEEIFQEKENWPSVILLRVYHMIHVKTFIRMLPSTWEGTLFLVDKQLSGMVSGLVDKEGNIVDKDAYNMYLRNVKENLRKLDDDRVRWLDSLGISKEMRMYSESGPSKIGASQHFHRFCDEGEISVCSNTTEMLGQLLLGHAIGPKTELTRSNKQEKLDLVFCHACPKHLLPFHITPHPNLTCMEGPFQEQIQSEIAPYVQRDCPRKCLEQKPDSTFKTQSDTVKQRYCPSSFSKSNAYLSKSNVKVRDNGKHAIVHVGLAKTGSTTIQRQSIDLKESIKLDGFEMPWGVKIREEEHWQVGDGPLPQMKIFSHCFLPVRNRLQYNEATGTVKKVQHECDSDILQYGSDIAARNQSVFLSSEDFSRINETGIEELSEYLSQWSKQTIIIFYRRYYDWITSLYRQNTKTRALKDTQKWERSILDFASMMIKEVPMYYVSELENRLEKKFDNIIVMNFHDSSKAGPHETLFCDRTLNMTHTCEEIQKEDEVPHENEGVINLDYFDLVYGAMKARLIKIDSDKKMHQVATKVQDYHQSMLNSKAFKRVCPTEADLEMLLNMSLTFELKYFPGQADTLESDFKKQSTTKLCKVDVDQTLKRKEWGEFFSSYTSNNMASNDSSPPAPDLSSFINMTNGTVLLPKESEPVLSNKTTETTFQYDLQNAIDSTKSFRSTVGVLLYRPYRDDFVMYYNEDEMEWTSQCVKLSHAFKHFVTILRHEFPTRFQGIESDELAIVISGGDSPMLSRPCLASFPKLLSKDCVSYKAPILHFGSVFRNGKSLSNMISMPMSSVHLPCFAQWATKGSACPIFKETYKDKFEELIPQIVWRGTDFGYLSEIKLDLRRPSPKKDIDDKTSTQDIADPKEKKAAATNELLKIFDSLIPRWKGVVLTAEAEVEAQQAQEDQQDDNALPWADIKFTRASPAANKDTKADFAKLDGYINSKGEHMSLEELARYKYHIDLGGGGGTTWTGTIAKLAMPGLLFHHVTPTKDYIHDYMKPWTHYVPIKEDLSDLKEKYSWAESHPEAAKKIATQGSELIRYLGTPQGFGEMYQDFFVEKVGKVIAAYQPVSATQSESTWENVLEGYKGLVKLVCENGGVCQLQTDNSFKAQKYIRDFKSAFDQPLQAILHPSHFKPLIFGAGEGTTATHAFYDATCLLGFRSVHWGQSCNHDVGFSNKKPSAGVKAHLDLLRAYSRLKQCARPNYSGGEDYECPTVNQTLHVMTHRINQVISSPDIDAIHDAPYPNFGEYILDATENIRGKEPIVLLSERNPQDWTKRRIQQHPSELTCRGNDIGTDLYQCLQSAIQAGLGGERINTIFYKFNEPKSHANITIGKGFELYQNKMRKVSAYHTNLFERNPRIDKSQLAKEIGYVIANITTHESMDE